MHRFVEAIHDVRFGPQYNQRRVAEYVAAEQALGRLPDDVDPSATSILMTGAALVMVVASHVLPADARPVPSTQIRTIVDTLMKGLAPRTP
jgi:hypothetical protein